jgi:hypothetical protein
MAPALRKVYDQMPEPRYVNVLTVAAITLLYIRWRAVATGLCRQYLLAWSSADRRGAALWCAFAANEDPRHCHD